MTARLTLIESNNPNTEVVISQTNREQVSGDYQDSIINDVVRKRLRFNHLYQSIRFTLEEDIGVKWIENLSMTLFEIRNQYETFRFSGKSKIEF